MRAWGKERRKERKGHKKVENNNAQMSRIRGVTHDLSCHCGPFDSHFDDNFQATESQDQLSK